MVEVGEWEGSEDDPFDICLPSRKGTGKALKNVGRLGRDKEATSESSAYKMQKSIHGNDDGGVQMGSRTDL